LVRSSGSGETPSPRGGASLADDRYEASCERDQIWLISEGAMRRTQDSSLHERDEVVVWCCVGSAIRTTLPGRGASVRHLWARAVGRGIPVDITVRHEVRGDHPDANLA